MCGNCPLILSLHASHRRPMASLGCVTLHGYSLWLQLWRLFWVCSTCLVQINRVYERFLRYFCRPLLSGTCPVRLILFCFPSTCALGSIESLHFTPSRRFNLPQKLHLICQALPSVDVSAESSSDCALDTVCWIFSGLTNKIGWKKLQPFPRATRLFYDVAHCSPIHYDCINRCKPKQVSCILPKIAMVPIISSVRLTCSLHLLSSFL